VCFPRSLLLIFLNLMYFVGPLPEAASTIFSLQWTFPYQPRDYLHLLNSSSHDVSGERQQVGLGAPLRHPCSFGWVRYLGLFPFPLPRAFLWSANPTTPRFGWLICTIAGRGLRSFLVIHGFVRRCFPPAPALWN